MIITSKDDMKALVEEWGFLPLFKNGVYNFSAEELTRRDLWFSGATDGPWEWKGPVIRESGCAYGKLLKNKAMFVSALWYPDLANIRRNGYDFDSRWEEGLAPRLDKYVYDALEQGGPMMSKTLKEMSGFGKDGRKGFDQVITRLQMQGYIVTTDFEYQLDRKGNPYGWGIARYDIPERHFGKSFTDRVYKHEPEESRELLLEHLCRLFPETPLRLLKGITG